MFTKLYSPNVGNIRYLLITPSGSATLPKPYSHDTVRTLSSQHGKPTQSAASALKVEHIDLHGLRRPYWQRLEVWKGIHEKDFLNYRWQVCWRLVTEMGYCHS